MAPKRPQVVFLRASTVRSGSALPSLHQNCQPMSQGTYSASSLSRSKTRRAASMTSWPTPSPGIHAILYLAIRCRSYRRVHDPQVSLRLSGEPRITRILETEGNKGNQAAGLFREKLCSLRYLL